MDASSGQALQGVSIYGVNTQIGVISDQTGRFALHGLGDEHPLVFSLVGYQSDTVMARSGRELKIRLSPGKTLEHLTIEARREAVSLLEPINTVTVSRTELNRSACCNLSESFETNIDVDVEFSDAVTGAKQVRMLGLDGRYVQLLSEGRPGSRGLALPYGLLYIPGSWMSSIQITKGPGSVVNGYEAISGQLNVEYFKPDNIEKLFINGYGSIQGRAELNAHGGYALNEQVSGAWFGHGHWVGRQNDHNDDGFMDMPLARMAVLMNRWDFRGKGNWQGQAGAEYVHQDLFGGQLDSRNAEISTLYSNPVGVRRAQVWGKSGWVSPARERRSSGITLQGTWHEQQSRFGNRHELLGEQRTIHVNQINDFPLGQGNVHLLRTGASFMLDDILEQLSDPLEPSGSEVPARTWERMEVVPGLFAEYAFEQNEWSVIAGFRADYHNLIGWQATPRLHLRKCWDGQTTIRLSGGRGFRTVNPLLEFSQWLNSARIFDRQDGLLTESAWNGGAGLVKLFELGGKSWAMRTDYFYTVFEERVVADLDSDPGSVIIRQAEGQSRSHAAQIELDGELARGLTLRLAYKYEDVRAETAGELRLEAFVPRWRALISSGYESKDQRWQADATLQLVGPSRLPLGGSMENSPVFPQLMAQVTRNFERWAVYLGSENITNFHQHDAIRGASNPFGSNFDAAGLWGPVMSRNIYAGFRFSM